MGNGDTTPVAAANSLILHSFQSPGDVVVLTAAVHELHRQYPGRYKTDVRTPVAAIWENNPDITPIDDGDPTARVLKMNYPLVNHSNQRPVHFLEGYCDYLAEQLSLPSLRPHEFRGYIYLTDEEKTWVNQVAEAAKYKGRFWVVNAGSKRDFTCKQWPPEYFQAVIDHFRGRVVFVQIGAKEHDHPALSNVIDFRGQTDHRQLIRLIHHAGGVLTGVSYPMHLAAAVPRPSWMRALRPCVVVGGGREPVHWEQYPGHQFLHTISMLSCCAEGGCWRSRTIPLGDGDGKDRDLCEQPHAGYPRCMWLIRPDDVVRAIEKYLNSG